MNESDPASIDLFQIEAAKQTLASMPVVDQALMREERLARLQSELQKRDLGGMLLYDPVNVRFATDCRNMQIWTMHNSARYCLVPSEGKATIFDYVNCEHLSEGIETIGETRPAVLWFYHSAGSNRQQLIEKWADEVADVINERFSNRRIAIDRLDGDARDALEQRQVVVSFGQDVIEHARCIKTGEEQKAQARSAFVCETGLARLKEITRPGVTENEL